MYMHSSINLYIILFIHVYANKYNTLSMAVAARFVHIYA